MAHISIISEAMYDAEMPSLREMIIRAIEKPVDAVSESGWPTEEFNQSVIDVIDALISNLPKKYKETTGYKIAYNNAIRATEKILEEAKYE